MMKTVDDWRRSGMGWISPELIKAVQDDVLDECIKQCDERTDWPDKLFPDASIDEPEYYLGIRRGLIIATNALRKLRSS